MAKLSALVWNTELQQYCAAMMEGYGKDDQRFLTFYIAKLTLTKLPNPLSATKKRELGNLAMMIPLQ